MLLTLKVGNTTIAAGVFKGKDLIADWSVAARHDYTPDELGMGLVHFLQTQKIAPAMIRGIIINSVVPPLNWALSHAARKYFAKEAIFLDHKLNLLPLDVKEPERVGADRIADCIAGFRLYGGPLLIIDFGTATTFNLVSKEGSFLGGAIAPTMELASESLIRTTAQLFKVELLPPQSVIGKDTAENLQSGVVLGFLDLVSGLIDRFRQAVPEGLCVVATGGRGGFFKNHIPSIEIYDEHLALKGLLFAWEESKLDQKRL